MKTRILICLLLAVFSFNSGYAQKSNKKITITGYVVDGTHASVANAIVKLMVKRLIRLPTIKDFIR
jgi:hypothetical protein